jgi:hypothetical protein
MANITLTELEKEILLGMNYSEYGEELGDTLWLFDCIEEGKGKSNSGVVSSLSKKNLVKTNGEGTEQVIWLTELGIQVCKENNLLGKFK